jgi:hypothetical protein
MVARLPDRLHGRSRWFAHDAGQGLAPRLGINSCKKEVRGRPFHLAGERNPNVLLKSILSLTLATVMLILLMGWEKEDTMNATACCNGKELTYCEELCIFPTEKTEGPQTFWYTLPEGFSGP